MTEFFSGAGIAVKMPDENYINDKKDIIVFTQYAEILTQILYFMGKIYMKEIDYFNKYEFYGGIAEKYNELISNFGDEKLNLIRLVLCDERVKNRLYFAYGSNMFQEQMKERCKDATYLENGILENYDIVLDSKGYASIEKSYDSNVEGAIWLLTDDDERSLDRYEGVECNAYEKKTIDVSMNDVSAKALVYISKRDIENKVKNVDYFKKIISAAKSIGISDDYIRKITTKFE